ncbi:MAG: DUF2179 domain-containing protein [Prevotellaceae bacterium]|jgi:uncharacterized protein YebE (UPF0316 family)|nr:DUF2179 domain-containing protein [Prevotellaceae bacterium]
MLDTLFNYPYLPFLVFFARICDVTLGTLRIIFISKGKKYLAPLAGFLEVFIWIVVISRILEASNDLICYVSYAGGYAAGSFIGMHVEERLAIGMLFISVFTKKDGKQLVAQLNHAGYGATINRGEGMEGGVNIVQTVVIRKKSERALQIITQFDPKVFYVVSDVRAVQHGIFPGEAGFRHRWRVGK